MKARNTAARALAGGGDEASMSWWRLSMTFSLLLRRSHMYAALFLFPWMLMYAVSTLVMNHRALFAGPAGTPAFVRERALTYNGVLPEQAPPRAVSEQLLQSVGLDGAHTVSRNSDGAFVIIRNDLVTPRRLIYTPADHRLIIYRMPFRANALLERFHRRRGYVTGYTMDTIWAVSVDVAIAAMIFWALSGLWMWWEMKVTRRLGLLALVGGVGLFAAFLWTL